MDKPMPPAELDPEKQTAFKVRFHEPEYWGWFDAVNAVNIRTDQDFRAVALTIPQGKALGIEPLRYTAWQFEDGHLEVVRSEILEAIGIELEYPEELEAGCFPHTGGVDWFLIRELDHAMANITRSSDPSNPNTIVMDLTGTSIN